jgi:hypothetical protein
MTITTCRRAVLTGAGVALLAGGLAACDAAAGEGSGPTTSSAAAAKGTQAAAKALDLFPSPLQNQFAEWAFEYVDEGADVGEIVAVANDMKGADDAAYYDAWYGHATSHRASAEEAERAGKKLTARLPPPAGNGMPASATSRSSS